ncbi:MAG: tRNA1(Val) (adenine(37)-N6)-methyltransferase [Alphaproteobacteria bacterium]
MARKTYALLNGTLKFYDDFPKIRPALDSILLGNILPETFEGTLLDVGCGAGIPTILIAKKCKNAQIIGLDIQSELLKTARENAVLNSCETQINFQERSLENLPEEIKKLEFDAVITNPPFHQGSSPNSIKNLAHHAQIPLRNWVELCLKRVKAGGIFGIVFPTEHLIDILIPLEKAKMGRIEIKLIKESPKRLTLTAKKGSKTPLRICNI